MRYCYRGGLERVVLKDSGACLLFELSTNTKNCRVNDVLFLLISELSVTLTLI